MKAIYRERMIKVAKMAWRLVKVYAFGFAEAMKQAWAIIKLKKAMTNSVIQFFYMKSDGTIRQAFGTLREGDVPAVQGTRKANDNLVTYFDKEKDEWRCFKICNFIRVA